MGLVVDIGALRGRMVRLDPLEVAHVDRLVRIATEDRSTYGYTSVPASHQEMSVQVRGLIAARTAGEAIPFVTVRTADDQVVGMTRYLTIRTRPGAADPYAVEIGGTWLAASAQRTGINTEAKLLLIDHAFTAWEVGRVDFKTDARNERSRSALSRLGATFEGVLRSWQPSHAAGEVTALRDSAIYSITREEWPDLRLSLEARLRSTEA